MDIAGLSIAMNGGKVKQQASLALMKMAMNKGKENAQAMTEMIEKSVNPNIGQNLDVRG
ncbi:YjfB family protein [Clostridium sp. MSJ-11]|uniref:YjfB family protein n=1 Tax=Clostridium mobile TaxID=2841512 RepID=A0ABS6ECY6_9CLOT|nr:YjfB family protein [Clostridium mobile]MBU5483053.1 YjfB family protein [Clostridium mobile]